MAVYNAAGGTITIRNTTISGNSSIAGGDSAIINFGLLNISFSTIAENDGLGIQTGAQAGTASQITIDNSIVANNAERDCYWPALIDATWSSAHILSDGSCETSGVFERPAVSEMFLGDLAENGGPTQTHALLEGSLAIDAAEGDCPATDQRGASRPMGSECDLGAFEYGD